MSAAKLYLVLIVFFLSFSNSYGQLRNQNITQVNIDTSVIEDSFCCQKKYFGIAMGEIFVVEIIPWYFNRHVADDQTAVINFDSWSKNVRGGLEWDPNNISTNMFMHPYHGNLYFNAARSNGYNYWESIPFAFAGSMVWEMFGENNKGAINDWISTSVGGLTIGEALHRTAWLIRDNRATGSRRSFKEFSAFFVDPVGTFNRLIRGEAHKVGSNPKGAKPDNLRTEGIIGLRNIASDNTSSDREFAAFFDYRIHYGDPYMDFENPFDSYFMRLQINAKDKVGLGMLQIHGTLYGDVRRDNDKATHVFTVDQMFDYLNNQVYEFGGQSLALTQRSTYYLSDKWKIKTILQPSLYILTAIESEYVDILDRTYDFGTGFGLKLEGRLIANNRNLINLGYRSIFSHTLNGAKGNQYVQFTYANIDIPISKRLAFTLDNYWYFRHSFYREFDDIKKWDPEFRIGLIYTWAGAE